jgi:hypothetical protein
VAERRAAKPEAPTKAPMHIRAVIRRCTICCRVAFSLYFYPDNGELSCRLVVDSGFIHDEAPNLF